MNRFRILFTVVICAIASIGLMAYGGLLALQPSLIYLPLLQAADFSRAYYEGSPAYLNGLAYLLAYFNFLAGLFSAILLVQYLRSRSWPLLMATHGALLAAYLGPIVFDNTVGVIHGPEITEHVIFGFLLISLLNGIQLAARKPIRSLSA